jgi:quinol monooxygenase YgiN
VLYKKLKIKGYNKMSKIVVLASFYPKSGKNNEVRETILLMLKPTRLEQGNEIYDFYESKNDNDKNISFHLFEVYKDKKALEFHKNTNYYKNYRLKIVDLLERPIEVKILNSIE